jgi:geranylgeranyl pyrophosphate synthase
MRVASAFGADPIACLTHIAVVELIHSASLVLDDLPCMDNATFRRSRPAAHVQFGEATAILAAFALVILGVRLGQVQRTVQTLVTVVNLDVFEDLAPCLVPDSEDLIARKTLCF